MNILWFGPILKPELVSKDNQQSPASNVWETQQTSALAKMGHKINIYSFIPMRSYPKSVFISKRNQRYNPTIHKNIRINQYSYLNIKYIKEFTIAIIKIISLVYTKDYKNNDIAIFYNSSLNHILISKFLKFFTKIKTVEIIADNKDSKSFDAHIYLSYGYFKTSHYNRVKKYFFDQPTFPLINELNSKKVFDQKKRLTYAGALSKYGGITEFVKSFIRVYDTTKEINNLELHIIGHGIPDSELLELCNHRSIIFHGFVSIEKLQEILLLSDFFVNPRPAIEENQRNFPSKLITYLQYGKPIISSYTEGLSPKYKKILTFFDIDLDESIKVSLLYLISLTQEDFYAYRKEVLSFSNQNSINKMINEFNHFLENLVNDTTIRED